MSKYLVAKDGGWMSSGGKITTNREMAYCFDLAKAEAMAARVGGTVEAWK